MLSPLASARHCFPIFALGIEYFFAYQPTAENALEVLVVQKEVRRKWILNICIQNRRSSKFRFLFLVGNSYRIITHNSCRWQAVECQIKDWSIFEQTFTKWWMEQFHSCLKIQGVPTSLGFAKCNVLKLRKVCEWSELRLQKDPVM